MKKLKNFIKKLYHKMIMYFSTNRLFLSFVFLSLLSTILLRNYTLNNTWDIKPLIVDLALIVIIGSLGYLVRPKKQFIYFFTWLIIITAVNVVNSIYYTFYMSFATIGLLSSLGQTGEVGDSIVEKLQIHHFVFLIMPILFYIINKYLNKQNYYNFVTKIEKGKRMAGYTLLAGGILLSFTIVNLDSTSLSRLTKQWNREYIVERFGIILYQGNDFFQSLTPKISALFGYDEAAKEFRDYYNEKDYTKVKNKYTNIFKNKNVVFVHMESIQDFLIDYKVNGQEVTPNLNSLKDESLYFDNFYPQVGVGTSSDTEFTLATSLMPVLSGTVFVSYTEREYATIYNTLKEKGYYAFSMHGNKGSMWNRATMHTTLGFDDFYSKGSYNIDETIGLGLSDKSFFKQIIPIMEKIETDNKNYVGYVITLSNHSPFEDLDKYGEFELSTSVSRYNEATGTTSIVEDNYLKDSKMGNYLRSVHYADDALGEFINMVKESDAFDDTVFVFFGDHDARLAKSEYNNLYNYDVNTGKMLTEDSLNYYNFDYYQQQLNKDTPLIIWTKDHKYVERYSYPMGMIDVMPTLANMMGFNCQYCLGNDIFNIKNNNTVVFPNGNFLTNKVYYNNTKEEYIALTTDPLDDQYILDNRAYAERLLSLSNNIIVHDLIKKETKNLEGE